MESNPCIKTCEQCWQSFMSIQKPPEFNPYISGQPLFLLRPPKFLFSMTPPEKIYDTHMCVHWRIPT